MPSLLSKKPNRVPRNNWRVIVGMIGIVVLLASIVHSQSARAFLGTDEYDISAFCKVPAARRTIIYIDDQIMEEQNTAWANRLFQKLNSGLLPSESVSVVQLFSNIGSAKEIWSACWPDYALDVKLKMAEETSWFSKAPLKVLETQQAVFRQGLGAALTRVYDSARRPKREIVAGREKKKNLVAAIMADESRFHSSRSSARVIIYSDMVENSNYANLFSDVDFDKVGTELSEKLKFDSEGASIYIFGIDGASDQLKSGFDRAREFWAAFFKQSNGYISGFGPELNIPSAPAAVVASYDLEVKVQDKVRFGRMRIFADGKGQLQDSFVFFTPKANSSIDGTFLCRNSERCLLDAKTAAGTITLSPREELKLEGPMSKLVGGLGFPNDVIEGAESKAQAKAIFDATATLRLDR